MDESINFKGSSLSASCSSAFRLVGRPLDVPRFLHTPLASLVGIQLVKRAVSLETSKEFREARDLYVEAAQRLSEWRSSQVESDATRTVDAKIHQYRTRAVLLTSTYSSSLLSDALLSEF